MVVPPRFLREGASAVRALAVLQMNSEAHCLRFAALL